MRSEEGGSEEKYQPVFLSSLLTPYSSLDLGGGGVAGRGQVGPIFNLGRIGKMFCRHCRKAPVARPRGLCYRCYTSVAIRELYPIMRCPASYRGVVDFYGVPNAPAEPTAALPGTPEKIAVLQERAGRGLALWHPEDGR